MYDVSFQDIRELQMTDNPSYGDADDRTAKTAGNNYGDKSRSKWIWCVFIESLATLDPNSIDFFYTRKYTRKCTPTNIKLIYYWPSFVENYACK